MHIIEKHSNKRGFTLAEVLVTLVIIGVIAALTIPALIQNINDTQYRTAWKEAYSIINQASSRMLADNGGSFMNYFVDKYDMQNKYASYLSAVETCSGVSSNSYGNCFPAIGDIKYLDGNVFTSAQINSEFGSGSAGLILKNGFLILMNPWPACPVESDGRAYCGWIAVDVNGLKEPNTVGKDIFRAWVLSTGIIPQGKQGTYSTDNCSTHGFGCSSMYMQQ